MEINTDSVYPLCLSARRFDFSQVQTRPRADLWPCCYSADTSEANVLRLAAKALGVPEDAVEVKWTGGCWLARERREETNVSST